MCFIYRWGNTYKLLKGLKDSGAFGKIKEFIENDGIVIGGSAGAVIFGYDIDIVSVMDDNDVNLGDTNGFNCLNGISIFPHYTNKKANLSEEENIERFNNFTSAISTFSSIKGDVIALPEEDAIYVEDSKLEVLGSRPFYYFKNGVYKKIDKRGECL